MNIDLTTVSHYYVCETATHCFLKLKTQDFTFILVILLSPALNSKT